MEEDYTDEVMNSKFKEIKSTALSENAVQLIGNDWMLITAGSKEHFNTMTASWGGMGMLWNKPVMFIFIRPQRYTYEFVEREDSFTCSFFEEKYRSKLSFCGTYSGRDCNKIEEVGLTPFFLEQSISFNEARIIIECRKIYFQDINPENFILPTIQKHYPDNDFHRMYIGEITSVRVKNEDQE